MAVSLSHIGEALIARIANRVPQRFLELCQLTGEADAEFVNSGEQIAHRELPLLPYGGIGFDGASRVDLVIRLSRDRAVPFEIKLGATRLGKLRVDGEWLCGCDFSHGKKRFRGNMMSILERKFPEGVPRDDLRVKLSDEVPLTLSHSWMVVAKAIALKNWGAPARPAFSEHVRFVSFESIVDCYGGKAEFNELVREMLAFDYYDAWVKGLNVELPVEQSST